MQRPYCLSWKHWRLTRITFPSPSLSHRPCPSHRKTQLSRWDQSAALEKKMKLMYTFTYTVISLLRAPRPIRVPLFLWVSWHQPKMVRFSFCKRPLENGNAPYWMRAPPKSLPLCPSSVLENLWYLVMEEILFQNCDSHFSYYNDNFVNVNRHRHGFKNIKLKVPAQEQATSTTIIFGLIRDL